MRIPAPLCSQSSSLSPSCSQSTYSLPPEAMATKKALLPYDAEFDDLRFGEWTWRKGEQSLMPQSPGPGMDAAYHNQLKGILDKNQYQGVAGKNKAKIVFPLSAISGLSIDEANHTITFVLSTPPLSYLGLQGAEQLPNKPMPTKMRTQWDKEPTDFTDGAIKRAVAHTVRVSGKVRGFKERLLSVPRLAQLAEQGLPEGVFYKCFTQEELAQPLGKRAGGAGAPLDTAAPKRFKSAAPQAKKLKVTLQAGLVNSLPETAGPWMLRCIEKWGLLAPFDPSVTEAQWEAYYKERAALEWHSNAVAEGWLDCCADPRGSRAHQGGAAGGGAAGGGEEAEKGYEGKAALAEMVERLRWREDFDLPTNAMPAFCMAFYGNEGGTTEGEELAEALTFMRRKVQSILQGCKGMQDVEALPKNASSGLFITAYHVDWEMFGDPRTVDMHTRLYSPCGTARSIDFETTWHRRMRMSFAEAFSSCKAEARGPSDCRPAAPHAKGPAAGKAQVLYSSSLQDSGYERRRFLGMQNLRKLQEHLLGRRGVMSERKLMSVLAAAGGTGCFGTEADYVDRVNRRKNRLAEGEESDHDSSADIDFENEMHKPGKKSQYSNILEDEAQDELYDSDEENQADFTNVLTHPTAALPAALAAACPAVQPAGVAPGLQWGAFAAAQEAAKTQAQPWVFPAVHVGPFPFQLGLAALDGGLFSMQQQHQPGTATPMGGLLVTLQGSFDLQQQQQQEEEEEEQQQKEQQPEVTPYAEGTLSPQGGFGLQQSQQQLGVAPSAGYNFVPQGFPLPQQQQPGVVPPAGGIQALQGGLFPQQQLLQQQPGVAEYNFAPQGAMVPQQVQPGPFALPPDATAWMEAAHDPAGGGPLQPECCIM